MRMYALLSRDWFRWEIVAEKIPYKCVTHSRRQTQTWTHVTQIAFERAMSATGAASCTRREFNTYHYRSSYYILTDRIIYMWPPRWRFHFVDTIPRRFHFARRQFSQRIFNIFKSSPTKIDARIFAFCKNINRKWRGGSPRRFIQIGDDISLSPHREIWEVMIMINIHVYRI